MKISCTHNQIALPIISVGAAMYVYLLSRTEEGISQNLWMVGGGIIGLVVAAAALLCHNSVVLLKSSSPPQELCKKSITRTTTTQMMDCPTTPVKKQTTTPFFVTTNYDEMPELQSSPARTLSFDDDADEHHTEQHHTEQLTCRDILCGTQHQEVLHDTTHMGNQTFWRLIECNQAIFWNLSSSSRQKRVLVSQSIAQTMLQGGRRFLYKKKNHHGDYEELSLEQAIEKTTQALLLGRRGGTSQRVTALRPASIATVRRSNVDMDRALQNIPLPVF